MSIIVIGADGIELVVDAEFGQVHALRSLFPRDLVGAAVVAMRTGPIGVAAVLYDIGRAIGVLPQMHLIHFHLLLLLLPLLLFLSLVLLNILLLLLL